MRSIGSIGESRQHLEVVTGQRALTVTHSNRVRFPGVHFLCSLHHGHPSALIQRIPTCQLILIYSSFSAMAQYLPVLLVSVSAVTPSAPDDSSLDTQASGQVDYLSHNWQEEDVAKSWRNMTRRKGFIQNGIRLENASWRTWWKQRNNLPTVSPDTLNWSVFFLSFYYFFPFFFFLSFFLFLFFSSFYIFHGRVTEGTPAYNRATGNINILCPFVCCVAIF